MATHDALFDALPTFKAALATSLLELPIFQKLQRVNDRYSGKPIVL